MKVNRLFESFNRAAKSTVNELGQLAALHLSVKFDCAAGNIGLEGLNKPDELKSSRATKATQQVELGEAANMFKDAAQRMYGQDSKKTI